MRRLLLAACLGALLVVPGAGAHRDPCHLHHTCPSDHHTYPWHGLLCTSYADERVAADTRAVVVGGRRYWCHRAATAISTRAAPRGSLRLGRVTRSTGCRVRGPLPDPPARRAPCSRG